MKEEKERAIGFLIGLFCFVEGLIMSQRLVGDFRLDAVIGLLSMILGCFIMYNVFIKKDAQSEEEE